MLICDPIKLVDGKLNNIPSPTGNDDAKDNGVEGSSGEQVRNRSYAKAGLFFALGHS